MSETGDHASPEVTTHASFSLEVPPSIVIPELQDDQEAATPPSPVTVDVPQSINLAITSDFLNGNHELDFLWNDFPTNDQPLPVTFFNTDFSLVDISHQYASLAGPIRPIEGTPAGEYLGETQMPVDARSVNVPTQTDPLVSRLPSLEPPGQEDTSRLASFVSNAGYQPPLGDDKAHNLCPWKLSPEEYQILSEDISAAAGMIPEPFKLPSRHTMTRYLMGYFRGFHAHMPFLHTASLSAGKLGPELAISLAAVGALYRFEHAKGVELYRVARSLINWRLDQLHEEAVSRLTSTSPGYAGFTQFSGLPGSFDASHPSQDAPSPILSYGSKGLRLLQGLLVLMAMTSWGARPLVRDALSMASQVAMLVREMGIGTPEDVAARVTSWHDWILHEERRRTLFVAYVLFSLQCIAFDVPPMILNHEVRLNLPASAAEWDAQTEPEWAGVYGDAPWPPRPFQQTLQQLLSGYLIHHKGSISAFGNYVLIHGLFMQIFFARNAIGIPSHSCPSSLDESFIKDMEAALRAWQESWEATSESTLDPSSPKGPLGFNSTALLRLIYIRLNANTGPHRHLLTRDPAAITRAFVDGQVSVCNRSPHLDRAILQCIHALSVPVRVGIAFVARTQTLNWSFQHSLSNLECAFLLTHWLRAIAFSVESLGIETLRPDEQKLLNMVVALIRETEFGDLLDDNAGSHAGRIRRLAPCVARLWAETFKGFQVFEIVYVVGRSLSIVADTLEHE